MARRRLGLQTITIEELLLLRGRIVNGENNFAWFNNLETVTYHRLFSI